VPDLAELSVRMQEFARVVTEASAALSPTAQPVQSGAASIVDASPLDASDNISFDMEALGAKVRKAKMLASLAVQELTRVEAKFATRNSDGCHWEEAGVSRSHLMTLAASRSESSLGSTAATAREVDSGSPSSTPGESAMIAGGAGRSRSSRGSGGSLNTPLRRKPYPSPVLGGTATGFSDEPATLADRSTCSDRSLCLSLSPCASEMAPHTQALPADSEVSPSRVAVGSRSQLQSVATLPACNRAGTCLRSPHTPQQPLPRSLLESFVSEPPAAAEEVASATIRRLPEC